MNEDEPKYESWSLWMGESNCGELSAYTARCTRCGAVVADTDQHDQFHAQIDSLIAQAS